MKISSLFLFIIACFYLPVQAQRINFGVPGLYPEGTTWSESAQTYFVSSATIGTIGKVSTKGEYSVFYTDASLQSTFGMKTDEKKKILWVTAGDPNYSRNSKPETFQKSGRVLGIDITDGKLKYSVDLAPLFTGKHFLNDLALDESGNIFVTDSYSPVIYKIDKNQKAELFSQNDLFGGKDIGLNGIVVNPSGFLLVVNNSKGTILKVPLEDPRNVQLVMIKNFFPGADGLLLDKDGALLLVQNKGINKVFRIVSKDNWKSAEITECTKASDNFQNPSTLTAWNGKIYALNAKLNELSDSTRTPSAKFSLQVVNTQPVK